MMDDKDKTPPILPKEFEEMMKKIINTPKEDIEKAIEQSKKPKDRE